MGVLGPLLGLSGLAALIAGVIMWLPIEKLRPLRPLATKLLIGGAVAFVAAGILTPTPPVTSVPALSPRVAPSAEPRAIAPLKAPSNRRDANVKIPATVHNVGWYPPILNLEIDFGEARSGAVLEAAGAELQKLGRQMNGGRPLVTGKIAAINFVVLGGASSDPAVGRKIAHFTIDAATLRQLARDGASPSQMLDGAREVGTWSPTNDAVVADYCRSDTPFCQMAK